MLSGIITAIGHTVPWGVMIITIWFAERNGASHSNDETTRTQHIFFFSVNASRARPSLVGWRPFNGHFY